MMRYDNYTVDLIRVQESKSIKTINDIINHVFLHPILFHVIKMRHI